MKKTVFLLTILNLTGNLYADCTAPAEGPNFCQGSANKSCKDFTVSKSDESNNVERYSISGKCSHSYREGKKIVTAWGVSEVTVYSKDGANFFKDQECQTSYSGLINNNGTLNLI